MYSRIIITHTLINCKVLLTILTKIQFTLHHLIKYAMWVGLGMMQGVKNGACTLMGILLCCENCCTVNTSEILAMLS